MEIEIAPILARELAGNTVADLLISLGLMVAVVSVSTIAYRLLAVLIKGRGSSLGLKVIPRLHALLQGPFVFAFILFGIWQALARLHLPDTFHRPLSITYSILMLLAATWFVTRVFDAIIEEYLVPHVEHSRLEMEFALPVIRRTMQVIVWGIALTITLDNVGLDVWAVLTSVGIGGIALALAAQHTLGNVIGGFNILSDQHVRIGDRIQIDGVNGRNVDGTLLHVGLRTTRIRTWHEGRMISIPNSILAQHAVINVDSEDGRQMAAVFKLAPDTSHEKTRLALDVLKRVVEQNEDTKDKVITSLIKVSEISRDILLTYCIQSEASPMKVRSAVNLEIIRCLEEHDIQFTERSSYEYQESVF